MSNTLEIESQKSWKRATLLNNKQRLRSNKGDGK